MRIGTLIVACLLAGCEAPQEPVSAAPRQIAAPVQEPDTISAVPEHFDRVRAEQFEKEEESLRRRGLRN